MTTINHETGLPYLSPSILSAYSHTAETGPMTAEQFVEALRRLAAEDCDIAFDCLAELGTECNINGRFGGFDVDPLKAFELAYGQYREAQEQKR